MIPIITTQIKGICHDSILIFVRLTDITIFFLFYRKLLPPIWYELLKIYNTTKRI